MTSHQGPVPGAASVRDADGAGSRPSVGDLITEVSQDITLLLRQEVELAKAELKQSASRAGKGAGMFGGAGLGAHLGILFASIAVWWGIGDSIGHGWSALIVAVVWLAIAAVLAVNGRHELKAVNGAPQTADTVKQIPNAIKRNENQS